MTQDHDLLNLVEGTLSLLDTYTPATDPGLQSGEAFDSLLAQCHRYSARIQQEAAAPIRMVHHFACTGGTLMSRALACQPNTMVLSEIDPFSEWFRPSNNFTPSDLIYQARQDRSPPTNAVIADMFTSALQQLYTAMTGQGRHLVLRDHTHSHFCTKVDPNARPLLGPLLADHFALRQLITVRHPLDSFMSLHLMDSAVGPVRHLEGYAARYLVFLDSYPGVRIQYYEHFTEAPNTECQKMADTLELDFDPRWQDVLSIIGLSGDSGRKASRIGPRPRRPIPDFIAGDLSEGCPSYDALCARLGYDPSPEASPLPLI